MGHIDQMEKREAMEAIDVLERFSLRQAEQEIRDKMDSMRDAIMRGARLSEIQVVRFYFQLVCSFVVRFSLIRYIWILEFYSSDKRCCAIDLMIIMTMYSS